MRRSRLLFVLLALVVVALPLAAANAVWIVPSAPTSTTPITVFASFTCFAGAPSVTVLGSVITVSFPSEGCGSVPIPMQYSAALPLLAPGQYRVDVTYPGPAEIAGSTTFIVRDGWPKEFVIHPFAVPANPVGNVELRLSRRSDVCPTGSCTIRVGGVVVEPKTFIGDEILFDAPALPPGPVDVEVFDYGVVQGVISHSPAALYYFNLNGPPDHSVFERILFPVLFSAPGVGGSQWRSDAVISNPRKWDVWNYNSVFPYVCLAYPCGERLDPESAERFQGHGYPNGAALLVAREEAGDLAFSLRARDVSREADGLGTQLPVVREEGMFRGTMTLLNVPLDPRYRVKLRVYSFDAGQSGFGSSASVSIRPVTGASREITRQLTRECQGFQCDFFPYYADYDFPPGATGELVDLYVDLDPGYLGWAFVTVTNNSTQQVTIVTPDGKGGRPTP